MLLTMLINMLMMLANMIPWPLEIQVQSGVF